jgi:SpoIID/LytB domain protein
VTETVLNPTLDIGIHQRFGEVNSKNPSAPEPLTISAPDHALLTLTFPSQNNQTQTEQTPRVVVGIVNQALTRPEEIQRLILGSHKSFETAYASAQEWKSRGIHTEVAQPQEWQVWVKRGAYTDKQEKQLFQKLRSQNFPSVRLYQEVLTEKPLLSWEVNHYRYRRTHLEISSSAGYLQVGKTLYAGSIRIQPNAYGTYTVVNEVPLETYLRGVVPHEIGPGAPQTAIEAQAILARTYALKNTHRFSVDNYQLCADTHCQVYRGLTGTLAQTDNAITKTSGQVLTYNGQLVDAVYSSTNGGISAAFEDIWDGSPRPYLQPVVDSLSVAAELDLSQGEQFRQFLSQTQGYNESGISRFFRWQRQKSLTQLSTELRERQDYLGLPFPKWTEIAGLTILSRSPSGRVQTLQVDLKKTQGGIHRFVLAKEQIRLAFYSLLSTMFDLEPIMTGSTVTGYVFKGGGFGHGVGMSQYGSYTLSRQGYSASQILDFYYPGTRLDSLGSISWDPSGQGHASGG